MPVACIAVGIPGCGKQEHIDGMCAALEFSLVSEEEITSKLTSNPLAGHHPGQIEAVFEDKIRKELSAGRNIVVDGLFLTKHARRTLIRYCKKEDAEVIAYHYKASVEWCMEKLGSEADYSQADLESMQATLEKEPPKMSEGFSRVTTILVPEGL